MAAVGQTIRTALDGSVPTCFSAGNQEYDLRVMFPRDRFPSPEELGSIALFPGSAKAPPSISGTSRRSTTPWARPPSVVRTRTGCCSSRGTSSPSRVGRRGERRDPPTFWLASICPTAPAVLIGGEQEAIEENNRQLAIVVALAIFLVFVVLAVQYESVVNPLVIILAIPLSLIGVGLLLALTGTSLSAPVLLGVILLAGIVVNNAILLVEYAERARHERGRRAPRRWWRPAASVCVRS
ncbi:MAG: efflux RND transporter permease subunit [Candidatus Eisenbacteria bacterium]